MLPRRPIPLLVLFLLFALAACRSSPPVDIVPEGPDGGIPANMIGQTVVATSAAAPDITAPGVSASGAVSNTIPPRPVVAPTYPPPVDRYVVRTGDTLSGISAKFDIDVQELMSFNDISNANALHVGQTLRLPTQSSREAPATFLLPDSEAVYSPAYASFDTIAFAQQKGGYLVGYREKVDGEYMTGPQIIQVIAERYSVGPRVLLALLEFQGGWVTNKSVSQTQLAYSMGFADPSKRTLFYQASWAANQMNQGYYGRLSGRVATIQFKDRTRARIPSSANPGTIAVEYVLGLTMTWDTWLKDISPTGFMATYRSLFGDPTSIDPLVPAGLQQPVLRLPWKSGGTWYFTGGPHSPWGDYAAWGAIDLTPKDIAGAGCQASGDWAVAAAPGRVVRTEHGRVILSLGSGTYPVTGWSLLYMHMATAGRAAEGTQVKTGDPIGHPSCEGGYGNASHLHFARQYNGQWMDPWTVPYVLSGWQIMPADKDYDGTMVRGSESHEALDAKNDYKNAVVADDGL